jgi:chorismate mutase
MYGVCIDDWEGYNEVVGTPSLVVPELLNKLALRLVLVREVGKLKSGIPIPDQRTARTEAIVRVSSL